MHACKYQAKIELYLRKDYTEVSVYALIDSKGCFYMLNAYSHVQKAFWC